MQPSAFPSLRHTWPPKPPPQLSYWLASVFGESPATQQALLEEGSTMGRLNKEAEVRGDGQV